MTARLASVISLGLLLGTAAPGLAYRVSTHREIGALAVERSNLDTALKAHYGVEQGIGVAIGRLTGQELVARGAGQEDAPDTRVLNHFHNPRKGWPEAGGILGLSSIYWQQHPNQGLGDTWSWQKVRDHLFDFLTGPSRGAREQALAKMLRGLGQVMHMVQDASSPAHTRGDPHLFHDGYERHIEAIRGKAPARFRALLTASSPPLPPMSIFTPTNDAEAPVPIARLIDTDTYHGTLATYRTGPDIGLSEYTNGGYVSDDTIFRDFPLPRRESLDLEGRFFDPPVPSPDARRYFKKIRDGDSVDHFVAEGTLLERLRFRGQPSGGYILDRKVYEDYAAHLLPRAVSYSAALVNYFLRGDLEFTVDVNRNDPTKRTLTIQLPPRLDVETMDGTFTLYAENRDGERTSVNGVSITTTLPRGASAQLVFTPPTGVRAYVLAFRGTMGDEPGAVTGRVKPVGPIALAIQESAEFTGPEGPTSILEFDNESSFSTVETLAKDERKQKARGTFFSSTTTDPGKHMKRVSLEFDSRAFTTQPVQLLLDDVDVGREWSRATSPLQNPRRWEIRVDLLSFVSGFPGTGVQVPNIPRFLVVEMLSGVKIRTPLVWWRDFTSSGQGQAGRDLVSVCPLEVRCHETTSTSTGAIGSIFFGDGSGDGRDVNAAAPPTNNRFPLTAVQTSVGFVPSGEVAGHAVTTIEVSPVASCFTPCIAEETCRGRAIRTFAGETPGGPVWTKDLFQFAGAEFNGARKPFNVCVRPGGSIVSAPRVPEVHFRRQYLPADQSLFQELDVTPPEYEVTLK